MTPAAVLALAAAEDVSVAVNPDGDLEVDGSPSRDLEAGLGANVDALADLLARRADWHAKVEEAFAAPGPCELAAQSGLPDGLIGILDERGVVVGWQLDPAWKG